MTHSFQPSPDYPDKCEICHFLYIDHTDRATCDHCGASGLCNVKEATHELLCDDCFLKDDTTKAKENFAKRRINMSRTFDEIDSKINISTDIFNAKTIAIHELKKAIDADLTIPEDQKYYTLAQHIDARFTKLSEIIFEANEAKFQAENEQRAIQTYYNELGKKLRTEEREKLRLKDQSYKPVAPKETVPKRTPKSPTVKKLNVDEIRAVCVREGVPEAIAVVTMLMTAKKIGAVEAVASYKAAKSGLGK